MANQSPSCNRERPIRGVEEQRINIIIQESTRMDYLGNFAQMASHFAVPPASTRRRRKVATRLALNAFLSRRRCCGCASSLRPSLTSTPCPAEPPVFYISLAIVQGTLDHLVRTGRCSTPLQVSVLAPSTIWSSWTAPSQKRQMPSATRVGVNWDP